eukprot:32029-Chlamydomonas_euryale.AAC.1
MVRCAKSGSSAAQCHRTCHRPVVHENSNISAAHSPDMGLARLVHASRMRHVHALLCDPHGHTRARTAVYRPHIDGAWPGSGLVDGKVVFDFYGDRWSRLTFLIYLNDGFDGGSTTFYTPSDDEG